MFRSAVFKLTTWYVGALVVVCMMFSFPIYGVAASRLQHGAERQTEFVRRLPDPFGRTRVFSQLEDLRDKQLEEDRRQLVVTLLTINGFIIGVGALASYLFARRTLRPIEEAHAAQVRFTADASHELRTPLAVMQTEIEVALRNKKLTPGASRDILESNLEEVARLRQLSDQLLGLTRADSEPIKLSKLNLSKLVQDQTALLAKRHNLTITVDAAKDITVKGDKLLLAQVMGIIIDNAVAYSGLDDPKITVKLSKKDDQVILAITNQGKVIVPNDLDHLFDRFYRGIDATTNNPKGHGLGLALAKDIINRHQGSVSAQSNKKNGTKFIITLQS